MSGRDQTLHARERALHARQLRYQNLTFREIGKLLFGISRIRAFQLVENGKLIEEKQATIAAARIRKERSNDLALEIRRLRASNLSFELIAERLEILPEQAEQLVRDANLVQQKRAACGIL